MSTNTKQETFLKICQILLINFNLKVLSVIDEQYWRSADTIEYGA